MKGMAMKRILLAMLVLAIAVPASAASVSITADYVGDGVVQINYTADANVAGFGLKVTANDANIIDINDYTVGDANGFGIFPGTIEIIGSTVSDYGTPVAPNDTPGAENTGLGTGTIVLEMGALYESPGAPSQSGTLCTVTVDSDCQICVTEEDTYRAGVVMQDASTVTADLSGACVDANATDDCFPSGHPDYTEWVAVGKPDSWCYPSQCYGDADGLTELVGRSELRVTDNDVAILVAGYTEEYSGDPETDPWIAADFDHDTELVGRSELRVTDNDVGILVTYYTEETVPSDCLD